MREKIIFYKTDASFDYGDRDYNAENEHGIEIDFNDNHKPIIETLEGFGNFTYINPKYTVKTLHNELETHIKDIKEHQYEPVTFINDAFINRFLNLLKGQEE